ncbi:MAG: hypothetical protein ACLS48_02040 [[Eubacterium] siraeum]
MNEIIIANNSHSCADAVCLPPQRVLFTLTECRIFAYLYVIDGCIYVTEGDTDYEVNGMNC